MEEGLEVEEQACRCLRLTFRHHGEEVGWAQLHWSAPEVAEVVALEVAPAYRGRGLGRQILERCLEVARRHGARTVTAHTSPHNGPAYRLFLGLGFRPQNQESHLELPLTETP